MGFSNSRAEWLEITGVGIPSAIAAAELWKLLSTLTRDLCCFITGLIIG